MPSPNIQYHPWFLDMGATNHFTAEINNLNMDSLSYQGSDRVSIGNRSSLPIHHTSAAHLRSPHGNFLLLNLLHVLSIAKNLLFVCQFCIHNSVNFEFHAKLFFCKEFSAPIGTAPWHCWKWVVCSATWCLHLLQTISSSTYRWTNNPPIHGICNLAIHLIRLLPLLSIILSF